MKTRILSSTRLSLPLAAALAALFANQSAIAALYFWDTDAANPGAGGATPIGTWESSGTTWSPDSTGSVVPTAYTTLAADDLAFAAGTDATGSYIITVSDTQDARSLAFEDGAPTLSGAGTISLAGGGGITVAAGGGDPIISTNLTINGGQIVNVGAGRMLTLNTGTFTRGTRAALNIQGAGNGASTMTNLSSNVSDIIGPWASLGSGASTTYAKFSGSNFDIVGYTGGADGVTAATAASVNSTAGTFNYTLSAPGTLGANASVNTLRYTGGAGTINSSTLFTTKGIMNTGGGAVLLGNAWTAGASGTEIVINTANGDLQMTGAAGKFTGAINKTGPGTFTVGNGAAHAIGAWTVNQGVLALGHLNGDALPGGTINSGGTMRFFSTNRFNNSAQFTINAGGTLDIVGNNDTIGGLNGSGVVTGATGGFLQLAFSSSFSGVISGPIGLRASAASSNVTLSGDNTYTGNTIGNSGVLLATRSAALPGFDVAGRVIFNGGTIGALVGDGGWTTAEVDALLAGATKTAGALGIDTSNGSLTQWAAFTTGNFGPALGLTKLGANDLTLNQANTYTGNTRVVAGRILLTNASALQNSAYDTSSIAGGLDLNGGTTLSLGGLTGSVGLSSTLITGYDGVTNLVFSPQAGITQIYSGSIADGALGMTVAKTGAGTQSLSGANTYTGGTSVTGGALVFRNLGAKTTTGTHAFAAGTTLGLGVSATDPLLFTPADVDNAFAGNMMDNLSNVTVTATTHVGIDTTAGAFTYSSSIGNLTKGLVKLGSNTLTVTGANAYTGTTDIQAGTLQIGDGGTTGTLGSGNVTNAGTLVFNRSDAYGLGTGNLVTGTGAVTLANTGAVASAVDGHFNTTGALNFGATVGSTTVAALDLTNGSSSFGNLAVQTHSASNNLITLGSDKTLAFTGSAVTNAISVGTNTAGGVAKLQVTGAGTLTITDATRNIVVANTDSTGSGASAQMDLSGLATFNATVANLYVGRPTNATGGAVGGRPTDSLTLAGTNHITVSGAIVVGAQASIGFQGSSSFKLGTANTIHAATIVVGNGRVPGTFDFNSGLTNPTVTLRGAAGGTSRTNITLGDQLNSTGVGNGAGGSNATTGTMNFTGGTVDALIDTLTVGNGAGTASNNRGKGNGVFTFGADSNVDINTLRIGQAGNATSVSTNQPQTGAGTGTFTMNGGTLLVNTAFTIANDVDTTATTDGIQNVTGIFNQSGGTATIGTLGSPVNLLMGNHLDAANSGLANATLNLTGGTLNVFGDIKEGNLGAGTITSFLTLDGTTLDMKGNSIGTSGALIDTLTFASGTLQNVASINGNGGLTKTTPGTLLLSGTIAYVGDTAVSEGTLTLSSANPGNDASTVTIADAGATLNLTYTGTDKVDKLFIGSIQQANGVYGKSGSVPPIIGIPQITGDGTLTVGAVTPAGFSAWIAGAFANGTVPAEKQGPNDDPDNDGIRNLVEYAIAGQDPTVANASIGSFNGALLSFSKRLDASGLAYAIEESTDLGIADDWDEVGSYTQNTASTISYTLTPGTPSKNFLRLRVSQ